RKLKRGGIKMGVKNWVDLKIKKYDLIDIKLIQLSSAALVLMIAKLWKPLLNLDWYWYGVIFVSAMIKPIYKMLK
ncbi:unnamed protein product, partial [marine sediment metagenome]